jgi:hypothetical protein
MSSRINQAARVRFDSSRAIQRGAHTAAVLGQIVTIAANCCIIHEDISGWFMARGIQCFR